MAADISAIVYFVPIAAFLLVLSIIYAILIKTKIVGEHKLAVFFISFLIATIFISSAGSIKFIGAFVPAFVVLLVSTAFVLILTGLIGKPVESMQKGIGVSIVILFGLIFLVSAFVVYSEFIVGYLPGPFFGYNVEPSAMPFFIWLYSPRVVGAILLIAVSAIASWILVKAK